MDDPDFDPLDISALEGRGSEHRGYCEVVQGEVVDGVEHSKLDTGNDATKVVKFSRVKWRMERKQEIFLEVLARTGNVTASCAAAGVSRTALKYWRDTCEGFEEAYIEANEISVDALEAQARHLALHGVDEPIIHMGQIVAYKTKYSESMLALLLKAKRRHEFGDKVEMAHDVKGGVLVVPGMASVSDWEKTALTQQAEYRGDAHDEDQA